MVSISPESWGNRKPITVRLKTGLINGGIEALSVKRKKDEGQNRWVSLMNKIFLSLLTGSICGVTKNFLSAYPISLTPHAHRFSCS